MAVVGAPHLERALSELGVRGPRSTMHIWGLVQGERRWAGQMVGGCSQMVGPVLRVGRTSRKCGWCEKAGCPWKAGVIAKPDSKVRMAEDGFGGGSIGRGERLSLR